MEADGWKVKFSDWQKTVGYSIDIYETSDNTEVVVWCMPYLRSLARVRIWEANICSNPRV